MARKQKQPIIKEVPDDRIAPQKVAPSSVLRKAFGIDAIAVMGLKLTEIQGLLWCPSGASPADVRLRLARAVELYESLKPEDGAEGMLALQMVGTHDAALECLRRAALAEQTFAGRDMALKHAHKLMTLYQQQLNTLNKHRGKGQQTVTVKHVTVEAGGQAIVGTVETDRGGAARGATTLGIEAGLQGPMPEDPSPETAPRMRVKGRGR